MPLFLTSMLKKCHIWQGLLPFQAVLYIGIWTIAAWSEEGSLCPIMFLEQPIFLPRISLFLYRKGAHRRREDAELRKRSAEPLPPD